MKFADVVIVILSIAIVIVVGYVGWTFLTLPDSATIANTNPIEEENSGEPEKFDFEECNVSLLKNKLWTPQYENKTKLILARGDYSLVITCNQEIISGGSIEYYDLQDIIIGEETYQKITVYTDEKKDFIREVRFTDKLESNDVLTGTNNAISSKDILGIKVNDNKYYIYYEFVDYMKDKVYVKSEMVISIINEMDEIVKSINFINR
ncbi:hypothetical protein JW796_02625 [Candidatus Dojkabacteria bacterium]|nr:hypothetical protein [Candidatus Dojkabacteria bacterium]